MSKKFNNRFSIVIMLMAIFISVSMVTRLVLLFISHSLVDFGFFSVFKLFLSGALYDFLACVYYISPLAIYAAILPSKVYNSKIHKYFMWVFALFQTNLLVFGAFSEYFFWDEFGKRFNFIAVDYLVYTHEVIHNILESYPIPILLVIVFLISSLIFYFIYKKTDILNTSFNGNTSKKYRLVVAMIAIILPVLIFNVFDKQPLSATSVNQYNNELSKNGLYSLFSAFRNNTMDYPEFYKTYKNSLVMSNFKSLEGFDGQSPKKIKSEGPELKPNVILIMVESLSAEYMGIFGSKRGITPNLDALAEKSLFFDNFYATGTRTVRGMEAVVLSNVPTPGRSIVKRPDNFNMFSAGFIFKEKGYENKFIYAGHGYFDNMNSFFSHNGFETVDRTDMAKDEITFANVWGVCDEDLFNRVLKESDKSYKKNKPFFNYIMTTSNHRPYTFPEGKIDIPSHSGRSGGVKYTDYAINKFLDDAKTKPWFKNTVFVILADHNGGSAGKSSLPVWRYKIPLYFYAPEIIKPETISKVSSQIDLMPTLFSMFNWSYESKFYGKDILSNDFEERAFIGTYQKLGFVRNNKITILEPDKSVNEYDIVKQTLKSSDYKEIKPLPKDELDAITYYQSSSYFYKHKMNRWN